MTKRELLTILEQYDDDMIVLVPGYENGYDAIDSIETDHTIHDPEADWWDGEYQLSMTPLSPNSILLNAKQRNV